MNKRKSNKIYKEHCITNIRKGFFSQRVVNNWNTLMDKVPEIIEAETVNNFKNKYDNYITSKESKT